MGHKKRSTLLDLLVIVGFVALAALVVIPGLFGERMGMNEAAAIGGCKTIAAGQTDYN